MELELKKHLHKKLKARQIQDIPKAFRLSFFQTLKQYLIDYASSMLTLQLIILSFGLTMMNYMPGGSTKFKMMMILSENETLASLLIPSLYLYNFFFLYLDSKTPGMKQTKMTYTFKKYDLKASALWGLVRTVNTLSFGLMAKSMYQWAQSHTEHEMTHEDFLYQEFMKPAPVLNLLHIAHKNLLESQETLEPSSFDERIAA